MRASFKSNIQVISTAINVEKVVSRSCHLEKVIVFFCIYTIFIMLHCSRHRGEFNDPWYRASETIWKTKRNRWRMIYNIILMFSSLFLYWNSINKLLCKRRWYDNLEKIARKEKNYYLCCWRYCRCHVYLTKIDCSEIGHSQQCKHCTWHWPLWS